MKKLLLTAAFGFAVMATQELYAQQGFGTNRPDKSAAVDIVSTKRGLLIPRISIPDLDSPAPVNNPAISLFVYNDPTSGDTPADTEAGFYYWDGDRWVRFVSSKTEKRVVVLESERVAVDTEQSDDGLTTEYTVSIKGGQTSGQVLVTNADGGTEWVDPAVFVSEILIAGNGIQIMPPNADGKIEVKFDGNLTENTTINTGDHTFSITGLQDVESQDLAVTDRIVMMDDSGVLKITSKSDLLDAKNLNLGDGLVFESGSGEGAVLTDMKIRLEVGADKQILTTAMDSEGSLVTEWANANSLVEVANGLSKMGDDGVIHLGGKLVEEVTTIETSASNLLAINGLQRPGAESDVVYAERSTGILRRSARSISATVDRDQLVTSIAGYNDYVQEINIMATIGSEDLDITLPDLSATNRGQVINIKIMNQNEPDYYLNVIGSDGKEITYGAMPYQGWIFKCSESGWLIVGRN